METMTHSAAFILDFFKGEDFVESRETLIELPTDLTDLVKTADEDNIDAHWEAITNSDVLPELYEELIGAVIDMSDFIDSRVKFNGSTLKFEFEDRLLIITVDPLEVAGVPSQRPIHHVVSKAVMADLGLFQAAVKFFILDTEEEEDDDYENDDYLQDEE